MKFKVAIEGVWRGSEREELFEINTDVVSGG